MKIIIPTYRREKQLTFSFFSKAARENTIFVVDERDKRRLSFYALNDDQIWVVPEDVRSIAAKRQWILEESHRRGITKIVMFDDDLRFATRKNPSNFAETALRPSTPQDVDEALKWIEFNLDAEHPHAGLGPRQGNNNQKEEFQACAKMMYSLGYFVPVVIKECQLGRVPFREDYDITLQLLRKGFNNLVLHSTVVDNVYNLPGGCHDERTVARSDEAAELLASLHPGLVKVVEKPYKGSVPRKEVIVQWRKALNAG